MPIVPLFGHQALLARLQAAVAAGSLPASLLLHGPAGAGKQRLALQLALTLLCTGREPPCGECQGCRYAESLSHPDLHWYFPRPRLKDSDPDPADVVADLGDATAERVAADGLYAAPSGTEAIYLVAVRAMLQQASRAPALGRRKLFVVGDAERMVAQEGADQAANAFLKLLEEPPADTFIILTSSEPGALLPTIRSRVVSVRVPPIPDSAVREFLAHPSVQKRLGGARQGAGAPAGDLVGLAGGCPGRLLLSGEEAEAATTARRLLEAAASGSRARWLRAAAGLGTTKARGGFARTLDHLSVLLHERLREAVSEGATERALRLTSTVDAVDRARGHARGNVNPQLAAMALVRELAAALPRSSPPRR